ncbi:MULTISPECIES: LysR family transcriptional regulator [Cupriavidus]|uniref:Regulatory protein, LysR:LysR, substrate-binding protein n=1 Tax=Cupriavidus pinatubonensis (strain JMP 134 / LMG 1197) TaxID=264198 RepID=Q46RP0_CUPPJ|nr:MULTISPECIES: LysR family transcriptional regulator [Cupriavidus]QYY28125.1 LysR family transcriptional regulator [Cupriavidus pinatubonensis]TPQ34349.1 LysR family transcriptional regulator [Cupriavidus pinatubonensis]
MRITLDALQVVESIARCGTFALAGKELHKAPSSLSYVVQKLESDLGITVFDRSAHRVRLTLAGEVLLDEGRRLLRAANDLEERVRRAEAGWEAELKIATDALVPFDAILPFISAFQAENSYTRLLFSQELPGNNWLALATNSVDLLIGAVGDPPAVQGLFTVPAGTARSIFVVAPGHPLAAVEEPIDCTVLWQHQFVEVWLPQDSAPDPLHTLVEGQRHISVPTLDAKVSVLLSGLACGYLPVCAAQPHIDKGRLVVRRLGEERPPQTFHIAWRSNDPGRAIGWWIERKEALANALRQSLGLQAPA